MKRILAKAAKCKETFDVLVQIGTNVNSKALKKRKLAVTGLDETIAELLRKTKCKTLAVWAADCIERVLQHFEQEFPKDDCPRKAFEALIFMPARYAYRFTITAPGIKSKGYVFRIASETNLLRTRIHCSEARISLFGTESRAKSVVRLKASYCRSH